MEKDLNSAIRLFYNKEYSKAKDIFLELNLYYEAGLCCMLLSNFELAREYWQKSEDNKFASDWGLITLDLIDNKRPSVEPKYFQIRAFYEVYLSLLIENGLFNYAERLIKSYKYLTCFNLEVPKFIARVLHAYNYDDPALNFVNISTQENYVDVEALFVAAQIYIKRNEQNNAKECIEKILKIAPSYYPALQLNKTVRA